MTWIEQLKELKVTRWKRKMHNCIANIGVESKYLLRKLFESKSVIMTEL